HSELFSVGGLDFLIIHVEHDWPDYAVAWADKIIKRYPNRRVILSTHLFLDTTNTRPTSAQFRPNGTSAEAVWQQIIKPNCNVFMVINGHYPGEGRRTDLNNCGQPVHQILMDYQDRANGGDGWLRYFTFKPSENRIYAYTYSPTRNGALGEGHCRLGGSDPRHGLRVVRGPERRQGDDHGPDVELRHRGAGEHGAGRHE